MNKTGIEWTDYAWNPVIGCTHCSPGCNNCYAEKMAERIWKMSDPMNPYTSVLKFDNSDGICNPIGWNGEVRTLAGRLLEPLKVKKPSKIFVCSMSDLFHPKVPVDYISLVLGIIAQAHRHTFMILTKRAERMMEVMNEMYKYSTLIPNVWLGVTVCNQDEDEKISLLLQTPAAKHFISVEPMLDPINLFGDGSDEQDWTCNGSDCKRPHIDWVICGCESGANRRPAKIEWIRLLKDQCVAARVPFFLKQMEEVDGKLVKMPYLDEKIWNQMPEVKKNG